MLQAQVAYPAGSPMPPPLVCAPRRSPRRACLRRAVRRQDGEHGGEERGERHSHLQRAQPSADTPQPGLLHSHPKISPRSHLGTPLSTSRATHPTNQTARINVCEHLLHAVDECQPSTVSTPIPIDISPRTRTTTGVCVAKINARQAKCVLMADTGHMMVLERGHVQPADRRLPRRDGHAMSHRPSTQPTKLPFRSAQDDATLTLRPLLCGQLPHDRLQPSPAEPRGPFERTLDVWGDGARTHRPSSPASARWHSAAAWGNRGPARALPAARVTVSRRLAAGTRV